MVTAGSRVGQHASDFTPSQSGKMSMSTGQRKDSEEGGGGIYFPYQCCSEHFNHSDHIARTLHTCRAEHLDPTCGIVT